MKRGSIVAGVVLAAGAWFLLVRQGGLAVLGDTIDSLDGVLSPAEQTRALAVRQPGPGNAPAGGSAPSFVQAGGIAAIAGVGVAALPLLGIGGVALGITTAGVGLAIAFLSYELLRQRASMHVNDVRDAWERQFVDLHRALQIRELTAAQTRGSAPGTIEMAEVIFLFDHDPTQSLWHAVQGTQDERQFRIAAGNVDNFLRAQQVPVQDPA